MFNKQLYNTTYHTIDLSQYKFLVTGGAGFIGSNLAEFLLRYNAGHVRVLGNLSKGYFENIKPTLCIRKFEWRMKGLQILEEMRQKVSSSAFG